MIKNIENNMENDKEVITWYDYNFVKMRKTLLLQLYKNNLTEYLKLLGDRILQSILENMVTDDITGSLVDICWAIKNELEYRQNEKEIEIKKSNQFIKK